MIGLLTRSLGRLRNRRKCARTGQNVQIKDPFHCECPDKLSIGDHVYIGPFAWISAIGGVRIGAGTIIGPKCTIYSANHRYEGAAALPYDDVVLPKAVEIGENVWIGGNVVIVPGATIGEGCVVAAGSVVTKNIPALSVIGGNPARVLKTRDAVAYEKLSRANSVYLALKARGLMRPHLAKDS